MAVVPAVLVLDDKTTAAWLIAGPENSDRPMVFQQARGWGPAGGPAIVQAVGLRRGPPPTRSPRARATLFWALALFGQLSDTAGTSNVSGCPCHRLMIDATRFSGTRSPSLASNSTTRSSVSPRWKWRIPRCSRVRPPGAPLIFSPSSCSGRSVCSLALAGPRKFAWASKARRVSSLRLSS